MPANGTMTDSTGVDVTAANMRPFFAQASEGTGVSFLGGSRWTVDRVVLQAGLQPSYANVRIPMAAVNDETCPAITGVTTSPLMGIKIGTPCEIRGVIGGSETILMAGRVTEIIANIDSDQALLIVQDERWILSGLPIVGSFWASDSATPAATAYRQGVPWEPNKGGRPNARWVGELGEFYPMMCPTDYGITNGGTVPESADVVSGANQAVFWTPWMYLRYLRMAFASSVVTSYVATKFPWYLALPSSINWPSGADSALQSETATALTAKGQPAVFEGFNLWSALVRACEMCGPFTPYLGGEITINADKSVSFQNTISFLRKRFNGEGAITIRRPSAGNAATVLAATKTIMGGQLVERGENLYTRAAVAGNTVYIQRRLNSVDPSGFAAAWTSTDQTAYQTLYRTRRDAGDSKADARAKCNRTYPNVFARYRILGSFDFQSGTSESAFPRAEVPRVPLAELLTSYLEGTATTLQEKSQFRRPALFEYRSGGTYKMGDWNDGYSIDREHGYITLDGLREQERTFTITGTDSVGSNSAVFAANGIRVTLAIPCDHRLVTGYKLAVDTGSNIPSVPPDQNSDDNDRIDESLQRLLYADADRLYCLEVISSESYAVSESAGGTGDTQNNSHRDDSAELANHTINRLSEVGRLDRGGTLKEKWLRFAWRPGMQVREMQNSSGAGFPIKAVVQSVTYDALDQLTEIELA